MRWDDFRRSDKVVDRRGDAGRGFAGGRGGIGIGTIVVLGLVGWALGIDPRLLSQGYVVPDAFTHGSAEQRKRWFTAGLSTGDPTSCNTFDASQL